MTKPRARYYEISPGIFSPLNDGETVPSERATPETAGPVPVVAAVATGSKAVSSAEENRLRGLLDDANGKIHILQSMMSEAGFPMRVKWGEDLHGNEDWVRVRPECQLREVLRRLAELTNPAAAASNAK